MKGTEAFKVVKMPEGRKYLNEMKELSFKKFQIHFKVNKTSPGNTQAKMIVC